MVLTTLNAKRSVLINATNLHAGGAVQVAVSFISEIFSIDVFDLDLEIWISSEINENLKSIGIVFDDRFVIKVFDTYGVSAFFSDLNSRLHRFDLVFTVFGPNYFKPKGYTNLVGFAQLWILDGSAYKLLAPLERIKTRFKFFIQKLFFLSSDALVVELEHVKEKLCQKRMMSEDAVHIAHNCISSLYFDESCWDSIDIPAARKTFRIGYLGRDYPHKNIRILPLIKHELFERFGIKTEFWVTFNDSEWSNKSEDFRREIMNSGSLTVTQCPSFYRSMDAIIFPSLLECFSATPLEALIMSKPLFASDKRFVKDVCGEYAIYFDPLDATEAATVIAEYINNQHGLDDKRLAEGREYATNYSNARGRAEKYLEVIRKLLPDSSVTNC